MKKNLNNVSVNNFVRRQIKGSGKTYTINFTFEDIAKHAENQLDKGCYIKGYRKGVIIIQVDQKIIHHFICPYVKINKSTKMKANIVKRRIEEDPYIQLRAITGTPLKTNSVDIILYHHDVLSETNEHTSNSDWELIAFNAKPKDIYKMPMSPVTMMRNQLQLRGGTKGHYSSKEWADSIKFWQNYAVLENTTTNKDN